MERCVLKQLLEHIPKFRNGSGKILANASMPDFSGVSDIILGYWMLAHGLRKARNLCYSPSMEY
jgi:hypothetical protein